MKVRILFLFLIVFAFNAFGQNQSDQSPTVYNKNEFFAGYSENSVSDSTNEVKFRFQRRQILRGWSASYTYNTRRFVGVKTEVSGYCKN